MNGERDSSSILNPLTPQKKQFWGQGGGVFQEETFLQPVEGNVGEWVGARENH